MFAIKNTGQLWGWGNGNLMGLNEAIPQPTLFDKDSVWSSISCGGSGFVVGIKKDGTLWGWGLNSSHQLNRSNSMSISKPTKLDSSKNWLSVACGYQSSVGIKSDGSLWTWGVGTSGQLGDS